VSLADALTHTVGTLTGIGPDVVVAAGPPFTTPPAPPCYVVTPPTVEAVRGCAVTTSRLDVFCLPPTATDLPALLGMADAAVDALGAAVIDGGPDTPPVPSDVDTIAYRLTVEV